ncbi:hypothetical protein FA95DRAFT_1559619 [Auriscalpium vulgare]|uniref:Uncharacterized protein n=1 Tax=Auriscalpium vulgare TaxID=40419 RepID=A0ACB8RSZ0_9AGAM|nr:hypothetical protein FA95DRAFT_1559619 [Auriscalpium vulgare]
MTALSSRRALTADEVVALTHFLSSQGNQKRQAEPLTTEEVVALTQFLSSQGNQKRQAEPLTTDEVVALTHFLSSQGDQRRALSSTSKGLIGTAVSLGASALVDPLISGLGKLFGFGKSDAAAAQRRAITPEQLITAALLSGRAFDDLD